MKIKDRLQSLVILTEEELYNACYNVVKQVMGSALQKQYVKEKKNG